MFRLMVTIACLLVISDYALRLRRWYREHRQLRWVEKRIVQLSAQAPEPKASRLALPALSKWGYVALLALVIAVACAPAADLGNQMARITAIAAGATFWSIVLVGLFRKKLKGEDVEVSRPDAGRSAKGNQKVHP